MELMAKISLIFGAALVAAGVLRHRSAALRHAVWLAAVVSVLLVPVLPRPDAGVQIVMAVPAVVSEVEVDDSPVVDGQRGLPWIPWLWVAGSVVVALRFLRGLIEVARLSRTAREEGRESGVPVRVSTEVAVPFTWGVLRPVIILPIECRNWTEERRRLVLRHEGIHVARRDWLAQLVSQCACTVYWFHPLAWYAASRMRIERERACDDAVLRSGVDAVGYAGHLLELTRSAAKRAIPGVAMAAENELEARMRSLLNFKQNREALGRLGAIGVLAVAAALVAPLALMTLRAQAGGGLHGVIQDPSGGRIPDATLLLKRSGGQEIAYSGADGSYSFDSIPPGDYTLAVLRGGFARWEKEVKVTAGAAAALDVTLPMGRIQETVEVMGSRPRPSPAPSGTPQRIRVGGNVQASRLLVQEKPVYPQELQDQGVEGTVLLDAVIGTDGSLLSLRPANTMVHPGLVKAATDAVSRWRYQPTLLNGQPVEIITAVTVRFRLPQR